MTDPFEHFGEQQQSYEMLEEHRAMLAREAAEILAQHASAQPVGVIMEAGAAAAAPFRAKLLEQTGKEVQGFVGVMPRKFVIDLLGATHPQVLPWVEDPGDGPKPMLPLVAVTKNGIRLGRVAIPG